MNKHFRLCAVALALLAIPAAAFAGVGDAINHFAAWSDHAFALGTMLAIVGAAPDYAAQITAFETKRAGLVGQMEGIMAKAAEAGSTLDASEQEAYDGHAADVKAIDEHLTRLRDIQSAVAVKAAPALGTDTKSGSESRGGGQAHVQVKAQPKLPQGVPFARLVKCLGMARGSMGDAMRIAETRYGPDSDAFGTLKGLFVGGFNKIDKAAVGAGSTADGNWAADLVSAEGGAFADFVEYLRPATILGQFGQNGVPDLRRVPFRVPLGSQTGGGAGYWVGEGKAKPLTSFDFARTTLEPLKAANIAVLTEEIIRDGSANSETLVRDALRDALAARIDTDFIDPANAGTAGVKPASITNGLTKVDASGTGDADDIRLDLRSLFAVYDAASNPASSLVLIMRTGDARAAGMMTNALGQLEFPGVGVNGGELLRTPVITSNFVPAGFVVAVNASDIYFADEGGIAVDMSREASLEMDSAPSHDSVTPTESTLVSLWQTNSVGFRAERTLNWLRRRPEAVQVIRDVAWGGAVTAPTADV